MTLQKAKLLKRLLLISTGNVHDLEQTDLKLVEFLKAVDFPMNDGAVLELILTLPGEEPDKVRITFEAGAAKWELV